ncbi:putative Ig domain-containing protein [Litorisediminicola beolgyonensis]|uniref:Ig domain-containing protein n=1 Tax=Litorisediminicola beolgyonensis TaxID=1173614 RepID=A0ABW3ZIS6_9RHOB
MPHLVPVTLGLDVGHHDLRLFAGEALRFDIADRPAAAEIVVTMGEDLHAVPLVQVTGGDTVAVADHELELLPEGRSCEYNIWLRDGGDERLVQRGRITLRASLAPVDPALVIAPRISGSFEVGATLTLDSDAPEGSLPAIRWTRSGAAIAGETGGTLLLTAADEGHEIGAVVTLEGEDGPVSTEATGGGRVTWPAPVALGLAETIVTAGTPVSVDLSAGFTGEGLTLALAPGSDPLPEGLALSSAGLLSGGAEIASARHLVIRAENSGGAAEAGFDLRIEAAPITLTHTATSPRLIVDGDSVLANRPGARDLIEGQIGHLFRKPQGYMQAAGGEPAYKIAEGLSSVIDLVVPGETVVLMGPVGANQSLVDDTFPEIIAYLDDIYSRLLAAGAVVVAIPTLPDDPSFGPIDEKNALRDWVYAYETGGTVSYGGVSHAVAAHPGFLAVDIGSRDASGVYAPDSFTSAMKLDQSHPSAAEGAPYLARKVRDALLPLVTGTAWDLPNLLSPGAASFAGAVAPTAAGVTGTGPADWVATRPVGTGDWVLSRDPDGALVAEIANAPDRTMLQLLHGVAQGYDALAGDIHDLLAEIEVDPTSTGYGGVELLFQGTGCGTSGLGYGTPDAPVRMRTQNAPLALAETSRNAIIRIGVVAGATARFRITRAHLLFVENVAGALAISGTPATSVELGAAYSFTPLVAGGQPPYAFALIGGTLPDGLSLDPASGAISGGATEAGVFTGLALQVSDQAGAAAVLPAFDLTVTQAAVPAMLSAPTLDGTAPAVGDTLTADPGSWSNAPTSFAYQWLSSGFEIPGATAQSYTVASGDIGQTLSVEVIASNAGGDSAPVRSDETAPVTGASAAVIAWESAINSPAPEDFAYSDQDRTVTATAGISGARHTRGAEPLTGKVYVEIEAVSGVNAVGLSTDAVNYISGGANGTGRAYWIGTLLIWTGGSRGTGSGNLIGDGDRVQIAVDADAGLMWMRRNDTGLWNADGAADPASGTGGLDISGLSGGLYPYVQLQKLAGAEARLHASAERLAYAPPAGFAAAG